MDYRKAFERAVTYIENNLCNDIKVGDVARAAGYSYYHLNRQFSAILGESVGSYIKKRRLTDAAEKLIHTDRKIIDIAVENGFESPEAFSRAFKAMFKVSPKVYRQNHMSTFIAKKRLDTVLLNHLARNVTIRPKIVELPEIKVAGLRGKTTLRDNRLRELWSRANTMFSQIPDRIPTPPRGFGICEACNENTPLTMNEDVLFTEVAGIEVSSFRNLKPPFVAKTLPGGRYAVFTHRGTLRMLPQTFSYIWGTWFLTAKEELDLREDFELYDERFLGYDHPDSEMDLYIPVL